MNKTIGILAHVDAGKTTFSEQLLYRTHSIRTLGRVDHQNAFLDTHQIERQRGITIFSDQAYFDYGDSRYFLIDTPGHVDFSAEMERAIRVMDYAILLISAAEGVQGHTLTVFRLLQQYQVPTIFFLNKTDRTGVHLPNLYEQIRSRLTPNLISLTGCFSRQHMDDTLIEQIAESDDRLLEDYLQDRYDYSVWLKHLVSDIRRQQIYPCFSGSALLGEGIDEFLEGLDLLTCTDYDSSQPFCASVYKIRHEVNNHLSGGRLAFLKITSGRLRVKEMVSLQQDGEIYQQKINDIRQYQGVKYQQLSSASAGELCAVSGLTAVKPGDYIGAHFAHFELQTTPTLSTKVQFDPSLSAKTVLGYFRLLEDEDPTLQVTWNEPLQEIQLQIMGMIQLEILKEIVSQRFGIQVEFADCDILYRETIQSPVVGCGHFEPLRHYAEVHLLLEPAPRGSGIQFDSRCPTDILESSFQNLVRAHIFDREQKGVLLGAPLTDLKISLLTGRAHNKHTEGGDFREATYRAIRQGLEEAQNIILEPFYSFEIEVETEQIGRVISDIQKMYGSFETPLTRQNRTSVVGRGPVASFLNYAAELTSFTHGTGSISTRFDGYEPCHNPEEVIKNRHYDKIRDLENVSDSVFCSHGSGFVVKWDQAKKYMHCPVQKLSEIFKDT